MTSQVGSDENSYIVPDANHVFSTWEMLPSHLFYLLTPLADACSNHKLQLFKVIKISYTKPDRTKGLWRWGERITHYSFPWIFQVICIFYFLLFLACIKIDQLLSLYFLNKHCRVLMKFYNKRSLNPPLSQAPHFRIYRNNPTEAKDLADGHNPS